MYHKLFVEVVNLIETDFPLLSPWDKVQIVLCTTSVAATQHIQKGQRRVEIPPHLKVSLLLMGK